MSFCKLEGQHIWLPSFYMRNVLTCMLKIYHRNKLTDICDNINLRQHFITYSFLKSYNAVQKGGKRMKLELLQLKLHVAA